MSFTQFIVVFAVSGAAMALWIDTRFPNLAPQDLRAAFIRLVGGWVLVHLSIAAVERLVAPFAATTRVALVLAAGFVLLTTAFLTAIWMIKVAQRMMGGTLR